ncbi:MAG: ABC transporter substrate-binding protein [bacterium]
MGAALLAGCPAAPGQTVAHIKIGMTKTSYHGPLYIAADRGYFADEGLAAELVFFQAAEPVAVAVASGSLDFGDAGTSGGFFNLAGQGALRLIAGESHERPGFQFFAFVVSNRAYAAGFRSYGDLPGHSVAVTQAGSPSHYSLALIAEKYRIDLRRVRVVPLESIPNQIYGVEGGRVDAAVIPATPVIPAIQRGDVKSLGWTSDETSWQTGSVFTATKTANDRREIVERFLRAFRRGAHDYYDAFTGPGGRRADGPAAPDVLAILAKYVGQPVEQVRLGIAYIDRDGRLDVPDVLHQLQWFKSQDMVSSAVNGNELIDRRYVIALPNAGR